MKVFIIKLFDWLLAQDETEIFADILEDENLPNSIRYSWI
jgi:hypothetical protein